MVSNCKKRFIIIIGVIGIMLFSQATLLVEAHYEKEEPNVVVIYSSITGEITEEHRTLDMLIGHFTKDITFISTKDVTKRDLDGVTHLFYYGQVAEYLPDSFETLFDDYSGSFIAFGYNIEQLGDQFTFVEPLHEVEINKLKMQSSQQELYISPEATVHVNVLEGEIVMEGIEEDGETTYPIAVKSDN